MIPKWLAVVGTVLMTAVGFFGGYLAGEDAERARHFSPEASWHDVTGLAREALRTAADQEDKDRAAQQKATEDFFKAAQR